LGKGEGADGADGAGIGGYNYFFLSIVIYPRKIVSTNMLKNYYKKYPNIIRYKNQLIYMIAVWEPQEEK